MDIGIGIAIAGVWLFPSVCAGSKQISGEGITISMMVAFATTIILTLN